MDAGGRGNPPVTPAGEGQPGVGAAAGSGAGTDGAALVPEMPLALAVGLAQGLVPALVLELAPVLWCCGSGTGSRTGERMA